MAGVLGSRSQAPNVPTARVGMLLPARIWPGSYFLLGSCSGSPAFSFASLKPGFEEFKLFLGHTFSVFVAVLHHAEDGDGDQVGHKHEHLDPLNPSTNHLTALQDLQVGQELSCSVLYFANFYEKVGPELSSSVLYFAKLVGKNGPRLCFGLPSVVEDVQDVTGYGLCRARGGAWFAGETVSVAGCYCTQGIMDAAGAAT